MNGNNIAPRSPTFSQQLVNQNVFANVDSHMPTQSPVRNGLSFNSSILESSPRSNESSLSPIANLTSEVDDNQQSNYKDQPVSKESSDTNSRGSSIEEGGDITVDAESFDFTGLPSSLIVANLPDSLFRDGKVKSEFEAMYFAVDPSVTFSYFKFFRRARLIFSSPVIATRVRLLSHGTLFYGKAIKVYYHETFSTGPQQLKLPQPEKMFLISPPASPPVGWEQDREKSPIAGAVSAGLLTPSVFPQGGRITEDVATAVKQKLTMKQSPAANITGLELMAALAKLVPGEHTEILSPTTGTPGIVIETCEERPNEGNVTRRIKQTRCPDRS